MTAGALFEKNLRAIASCCTWTGSAFAPTSAVDGSDIEASGLSMFTLRNDGFFISSAGTGVAGLDDVRLWWFRKFSFPPERLFGVVGRLIGGVGGMSPVAFDRARTERHSIFTAVSGAIE